MGLTVQDVMSQWKFYGTKHFQYRVDTTVITSTYTGHDNNMLSAHRIEDWNGNKIIFTCSHSGDLEGEAINCKTGKIFNIKINDEINHLLTRHKA